MFSWYKVLVWPGVFVVVVVGGFFFCFGVLICLGRRGLFDSAWIYASCSENPQSRTDGRGHGSELCVGSGVSNPTLNAGSERIPLYPSWILRLTEQLDDRVG